MYIEFKAANGVNVMKPYGTFFLVENDGLTKVYGLHPNDNGWTITEEEFRRVQQEIRDITELQKKNLNCLYVQARVMNE